MWQFSKSFEFTKPLSENFKIDFNQIDNSKELYKLILKSLPNLMEFATYHIMSSGGSTFYKMWIMSTLLGSSQGKLTILFRKDIKLRWGDLTFYKIF